MKNRVVLLLGSNMGNKRENLQAAKELINKRIGPISLQSPLYETAPWGVSEQESFLNQVVITTSEWAAEAVLTEILEIELMLGRIRIEKWNSRTIDIDILYYNESIIQLSELVIPHPELHKRRFTLVPLVDVDPDYIHPILKKSNRNLLKFCNDSLEVKQLL